MGRGRGSTSHVRRGTRPSAIEFLRHEHGGWRAACRISGEAASEVSAGETVEGADHSPGCHRVFMGAAATGERAATALHYAARPRETRGNRNQAHATGPPNSPSGNNAGYRLDVQQRADSGCDTSYPDPDLIRARETCAYNLVDRLRRALLHLPYKRCPSSSVDRAAAF